MLKRITPFHPILFTFFPLLSLYSANTNKLSLGDIFQTILIALVLTIMLWTVFFILFRDTFSSAIATSIIIFTFFSFTHSLTAISISAHLLNGYEGIRFLVETRIGMLILLFIEILIIVVIIFYLSRYKHRLNNLTKIFNFVSFILILVVAFSVISKRINQNQALAGPAFNSKTLWKIEKQPSVLPNKNLPDIYYIILDGYGRSDILDEVYQYNNSEFVAYLESKGFYVAKESHANYSQTGLSLASSLNISYLDELSQLVGQNSENLTPIKSNLENNLVFDQLREVGYNVVSFSSGFDLTDLSTSDLLLVNQRTPDSFQSMLINNTPLSLFLLGNQYEWHRQRIHFTFDMLPEASERSNPTFVFAHILAPHPPFVFGSNGEPINPPRKFTIDDGSDFMAIANKDEYFNGYIDQITYITEATEIVVEKVLNNSIDKPVIIIQGDHGPGYFLDFDEINNTYLPERMSILNAYYMPGIDHTLYYPQISPVNSFRIVFNSYLGTDYPILEDRSYFSTINKPFNFIDVTSQLNH